MVQRNGWKIQSCVQKLQLTYENCPCCLPSNLYLRQRQLSASGYTFQHGKDNVLGCMGLTLMYCMIDKYFLRIRNLGILLGILSVPMKEIRIYIGALNHHTLASHIILIITVQF